MLQKFHLIKNAKDLAQLKTTYEQLVINENNLIDKITIIDLSDTSYDILLDFALNTKIKFYLNYFCLNMHKNIKKIKLNIVHNTDHTFSKIAYHGIGLNSSLTNLNLLSINNIAPLADIYSAQEIKEIILNDDAKFSGIPQIDANNNTFVSEHKLTVGSMNKEELFYLSALGLDLTKAKNILLNSLFSVFLIDNNDEQEIKELIQKELIEYGI